MPGNLDSTCLNCGTVNPLGSVACRVCGAPLEASIFLPPGERVGSFVVEDVLGRGGFGITYRARDAATGETVALKELFPEGVASRGTNNAVRVSGATSENWEKLKSRFAQEAQLLQRIQHRASTRFVALFAANDTLYLAMEFVRGETLEARLQTGKRLSMKEARNLLRDILGVLEEVHAAGLLHRDIKPANIILQPTGAELIDFGSGLEITQNRTMKISQRLLTPAYAPLELYGQNVRLSPASDLYSLAATVYEAVSGVRPASALERANGATLESLHVLRPDISVSFAKAVDAALEVRVEARPPSVAAFRKLLEAKVPASVSAKPPRAARNAGRAAPNPGVVQPAALRDNTIFTGATVIAVLAMALGIVLIVLGRTSLGQQVLLAAAIGLMVGCGVFIGAGFMVRAADWILTRAMRLIPMSFYRQSMLGVYSFGAAVLLRYFLGNWRGFSKEIPPTFLLGFFLMLFGLVVSNRTNPPRPLRPWTRLGLHLAAPLLIFGWFVNPFPSFFNSSNAANPASPVAPTPPSRPVPPNAFADGAITGNKWVCQRHLGKPFTETMLHGRFLIPLDDESYTVAQALEPRLTAKALPCSDAANAVQKFTRQDVSLSQDRAKAGEIIWQFVPLLETQLAVSGAWLSMKATVVLLTSKPITGTVEFLERASYQSGQNFVLVSTAALKPDDYQTFGAGRTILLERVATIIQHQTAKNPVNLESLEALDALWSPVAAAQPPSPTPQTLLKRLPGANTVLRLERAYQGGIQVGSLSPNGRFAAVSFPDGDVRVWDTTTGTRRGRFFVKETIEELSLDSAGQFVAVATRTQGTTIMNLEHQQSVGGVDVGLVTEVLFSQDGRYLLTARTEGTVSTLELLSVAALRQGKRTVLLRLEPGIGVIWASAFNAAASYLAVGGDRGQMRVYALQKLLGQARRGERLQGALPLKPHVNDVRDIAFSADGHWMASADGGGDEQGRRVRLWDVRAGFRLVKELLWGVAVAFSPDSQQLLFSDLNSYRTVKLLSLTALKTDGSSLGDIGNPVFALGFAANRRAIGISSAGIHVLDTKKQLEVKTFFSTPADPSHLELDAKNNLLWMAQYDSEELGRLELNGGRYTVRRFKNSLDGSPIEPKGLSLGVAGNLFVFASDGGGGATLLEVDASRVKRFANPSWDAQDELLVSPNGQWAIGQRRAQRFDLRSSIIKTTELRVPGDTYHPQLSVFAPDSGSLYSFNSDEGFTQWNLETARPVRRFGNRDGIPRRASDTHLRLSRDGRFFVTARKNGRVRLWDARTGQHLADWHELEDASYDECCYDATRDLQISPDGRYAVASTDRGAAIFDLSLRRAVARFDLNGAAVEAFAFHPDGNRLYLAADNGVIRQYTWR